MSFLGNIYIADQGSVLTQTVKKFVLFLYIICTIWVNTYQSFTYTIHV
jgi:hypothetical protein